MLRKVETRRLTDAPASAILALDKKVMNECGFPTKEDYNVLYEDGKITLVKTLDMLEVKNTESKIEKKEKIRVELTKDDLQRIEIHRKLLIKLYIEKGFTEEDALIDFDLGFPVMQLIKYQNGKCGCGADLDAPVKGSPKEEYQGLSHQAMKNENDIGKYDIIGFDHGYRLYCMKCSGM